MSDFALSIISVRESGVGPFGLVGFGELGAKLVLRSCGDCCGNALVRRSDAGDPAVEVRRSDAVDSDVDVRPSDAGDSDVEAFCSMLANVAVGRCVPEASGVATRRAGSAERIWASWAGVGRVTDG
jgi:hypothetical protein